MLLIYGEVTLRAIVPIIFTLVASTAAAQDRPAPMPPAPPPPPIRTVVAPPPPVMVAPAPVPMVAAPSRMPPAVVQIELLGGAERLWSGDLRIGGYNNASFSSTVTEAPETCPADKSNLASYAPNSSRTIRVAVSRRGYDAGNNGFFVSASWTRPGLPCEEYGSSTVSFDRPIKLEVGSKAEMKGDGGLVVRLTRLK